MAQTNEFERDLINQAQLKHPGRIDLVVFQNTADAGDGHPGVQRCFRNYLHDGGMEKDLQLIGYGIKGTSVDINNTELQQLSNIGASVITASIWTQVSNIQSVTITNAQWGYVGGADQTVKIADSPTFGGLSLTGNLTLAANSITGTSVDINNVELQQLSNIGSSTITSGIWTQIANIGSATISGTQWSYVGAMNQGITQTSNVAFGQITMSGNIIMGSDDITFTAGGLVDGVDVSAHTHGGAGQGGTVDHINLSNKGSNTHAQIDAHVVSTSTPHVSTAEKTSWGTAVTHISENGSSHSYINQGVTTTSNPTFNDIICGKVGSSSEVLYVATTGAFGVTFQTNSADKWHISGASSGHLTPATADITNIGSSSYDVLSMWVNNLYYKIHTTYSAVDDLQLIREAQEDPVLKDVMDDEKEEVLRQEKVWDTKTLPWIKARNDLKDKSGNDLEYGASISEVNGFLFSSIKKLLERQDRIIAELNDLEININF